MREEEQPLLNVHVPVMERCSSSRPLGRLATLIDVLVASRMFCYGAASQAYNSLSPVIRGSFR